MKFPLSWLQDWVEVPSDLNLVSDLLIRIGVGLEAVENPGAHMDKVVVARILKRAQHPNADKLSLCDVDKGGETLRIVCGAQNYKEGDLVPLAQEGAVLPGDFKIKRSKIRGEESFGMLCSSEELGLGKGEDGLLILPQNLKPGTPLAEALGLNDPVLTLETTANRPDHLSIRGIAREIAALTGKPMKDPSQPPKESGPAEGGIKVETEDAKLCPRYSARVIRGVKPAASPDWMQQRLKGAGIRPINNLVDVTNYVLIEYGQPLHAFDLAKLKGPLTARPARTGEMIRTLDGQDRTLEAGDIVIGDASGPQALGGVMGGAASAVSDETKDVLLEAALFQSKAVRLGSRRLGLRSESSLRFERGVDPGSLDLAMDRACALILSLAGGSLAAGRLQAGPGLPAPEALSLDPARANALLGTSLSGEEMGALLKRRGFEVSGSGPYKVLPPPHRRDLDGEADLAEEIAHLGGLDSIPSTFLAPARPPEEDAAEQGNLQNLKAILARLGLQECRCGSFVSEARLAPWGLQAGPRLDSPLSEEEAFLRPSLLPNLMESVLASLRRQAEGRAVFELGRVFSKDKEGLRLAAVLSGQAGRWPDKARALDFSDLSGLLEGLAQELRMSVKVQPASPAPPWLHPGQAAMVQLGPLRGLAGALHPSLAAALDLRVPALALELEGLEQLQKPKAARFKDYSRLPFIERDLSCLTEESFEAGRILEVLAKKAGFQPSQLRIKDVFRGAPLPEGRKSITLSMRHLAGERSLTDEEVNLRHKEVCALLRQSLPVEIRD